MKKLIILSLILAAGLTAYPQSSRSSREAKSSKSSSSQVASRSASGSKSKQIKSTSSRQNNTKATSARSSSAGSAVSRSSNNSKNNRSAAARSYSGRSSSNQDRSSAVRSGNSNSRSSEVVRSSRSASGSAGNVKSGNPASRSYGNTRSGNDSRSSGNRAGENASVRSKSYSNSSSGQRTARSSGGEIQRNVLNSTNQGAAQDKGSNRSGYPDKAVRTRTSDDKAVRSGSSSGDSFNRSNRQGSKVYVRDDGREFRHQNDDVFVRARYRVDYRDMNDLRRSSDYIRVRDHYYNWYSHRHPRRVVVHNHLYHPLPLEVRIARYPYRRPVHIDLCWTPYLHRTFVYYYPLHERWNLHYGDYIETASSYEAVNYAGTVKRVYGRVEEVYYSPEDRTYTLYFGANFPYHDFSVVVPRDIAKSFSWSPSWYFEDEHIWVVGLIEMWEGKPEIVIHDEQQIRRY